VRYNYRDSDYYIFDGGYPFWPMFFIWAMFAAFGAALAFIKALPAILAALVVAAPVLTICACVLMMVSTSCYLSIKNNDARYWFLPVFPILLLWQGGRELLARFVFAGVLSIAENDKISTVDRKKIRG